MDFYRKEEKNIEIDFHHPVGMLDRDQRTIKGFKPKIITQNDITNIYNNNCLHQSYHRHQHHHRNQHHYHYYHQHHHQPQHQQHLQLHHQQQQLLQPLHLNINNDTPNNITKTNCTWYMATNNDNTKATTNTNNNNNKNKSNSTTLTTVNPTHTSEYILKNKSDKKIIKHHLNNDKCIMFLTNNENSSNGLDGVFDGINTNNNNKSNNINNNDNENNKWQHKKVHNKKSFNYFNNRKQNNSYLILIIYITFELFKISGNIVAAAPYPNKMRSLQEKLSNPCELDHFTSPSSLLTEVVTSSSPSTPTDTSMNQGTTFSPIKQELLRLHQQFKVSLVEATDALNNFTLAAFKKNASEMQDWNDHDAEFLKSEPTHKKLFDQQFNDGHLDDDIIITVNDESVINHTKWLSKCDNRLQRFVIGFQHIIDYTMSENDGNLNEIFISAQNHTLTVLCEVRSIRQLTGIVDDILIPSATLPEDTIADRRFTYIVFREYVNQLQYMVGVTTKILKQIP